MLRFDDIGFDFAGAPVVDALDLEVGAGKLVVVLGRSGCGKTTMLRLAAGLLAPTRGRLINTFQRTAFVFQEPRLLPWATALDNAALGLKALGVPHLERRKRAEVLLTQLGLGCADLGKRPHELSGGMAQRVAIARALAIDPQLMLMDEPFGALDTGLRREMQDLVREKVDRGNLSILFVTHDVPEAVRLADRLVVLSRGPAQVLADLPNEPQATPVAVYEAAAALLRHPDVERALTPGQ